MSNIFTESALTIFDVLKSITNDDKTVIKEAKYVISAKDGWGKLPVGAADTELPIEIVLDQFSQDDVHTLTFSKLIQPTDTKGLVPGESLLTVEPSTAHKIQVSEKAGTKEYAIVAFDVDPAGALYTFLLRRT